MSVLKKKKAKKKKAKKKKKKVLDCQEIPLNLVLPI
jgi:hypothetical protein